jgi:hypothetical protein
LFNINYKFAICHNLLKVFDVLCKIFWKVANLSKLSNSFKEFISGARELWLEEWQPEDLGIFAGFECFTDLSFEVVVDDIFNINRI